MTYKRNTYPLPRRLLVETETVSIHRGRKGKKTLTVTYTQSRPYQREDVLPLMLAGGWFDTGAEFDQEETSAFAREVERMLGVLFEGEI